MATLIFLIVFLISTIIVSLVGILFGYDIYIMPNIDETKMGWKDRLFNPFIIINKREDPCWFIVVRIVLIISLIGLGVIAYFFPRIPVECYQMSKRALLWLFDYGKEKIEDIHYHRNAMKVKNGPYLEDFDNL